MKLYYICSDFYPSGTGFAISFTNFIQFILDSNKFEHITILTTNSKASLPENFNERVSLQTFDVRGELKLARYFRSSILLDLYSIFKYRRILHMLKCCCIKSDDVFFYEEFYFGNLYKYLKRRFPCNKHIIRVHGTMPEFVTFDRSNRYRKILFKQALELKNNRENKITIATTTSFYIDFINTHILKNQYGTICNVDYIFLPNSIYSNKNIPQTQKSENMSNSLTLLQLGRMDKGGYFQKGFDDTIKALNYINSDVFLSHRIRLVTIGSGEKKKYFKDKMRDLKNIAFEHYENINNEAVNDLIMQADVILLPSRCEGMSMFAVEAISLGKPIITTRNTGVDDICIEGVNSLKFDMFNYVEYAQAIEKIIKEPHLIRQMGYNAFAVSKENEKKLKANIEAFL
ncbi:MULTISPECIES: glycosyltransferase family 4 protein [Enterobacteriaceae]|uniref:Glycosyltransferase n=1 Tax=Shigella boydii TaxID=621 RepID=B5L3V0_SHIBO|nr:MULTISPECIES: glycosyltransferase family 4 protein [Enterobacteriaceae]EFZ0025529.1 glycosyltransferase [Shigella dysenteriae]ACD37034.1 WfdF [Shigella boydii]AHL68214.1 glycosyltransferase [Shigella boydii]EAA0842206.1 glycosyl hydrolase family 1 [Shigella boydii]EEY8694222.1 glycosyltransferase [Escherichia coli]